MYPAYIHSVSGLHTLLTFVLHLLNVAFFTHITGGIDIRIGVFIWPEDYRKGWFNLPTFGYCALIWIVVTLHSNLMNVMDK